MKQKQKKNGWRRGKQDVHYPAYYLAVVLAAVLILEGFLLGAASPQAWQDGVQLIDMSEAVNAVFRDVGTIAAPMMDQVGYINDFYQLAATELMFMLDFSDADYMAAPRMVMDAFDMASVEVARLIDFSAKAEYWPQVAGASLER